MELSATSAKLTLGVKLKQAREHQGLTVDDVASTLKLLPRIIDDLEADKIEALPQAVFVKGYVRLYGELLQLPIYELMLDFEQQYPNQPSSIQPPEMLSNRELPDAKHYQPKLGQWSEDLKAKSPHSSWLSYVFGLVLLVAMLVGVWQSMHFRAADSDAVQLKQAEQTANNVINLPNVTTSRATTDILQLSFSGDTQVFIKDANGTELANAMHKNGDTITVQGESPFAIELSPASTVLFTFNEKNIDLKPYIVNDKVNFRLSR
ncbi:MAG TPA: DUF4115 domain-containing protein [Agitococcus sp.]|nr:DUF4115 domain-containing protein [Agitococcus sp.]